MSAIFPVKGIFTICFNPETSKFQALSEPVKGDAIGTSSQSEVGDDGTSVVHACFIVQGRTPEGQLMHRVVKVQDFIPSSANNPGKITM